MRCTCRGAPIAVLLMGAMALAQPATEPPPQPPAGAPDAGSPAPAPAPAPPPKPEPKAEPKPPEPPKAEPKPEPKPPEPPKAEPKPEPKTDAGTAAQPEAAPAPPPPPQASVPPALTERAHLFFAALLAGEPGPIVQQAELPFFLEDKRLTSVEQLKTEWLNALRSKRTDLLAFKGFEVLTPAEMEQRFGKPPARLSSWPISSGRTYLVVANVSGRAVVALYHLSGEDWRIVAYHD